MQVSKPDVASYQPIALPEGKRLPEGVEIKKGSDGYAIKGPQDNDFTYLPMPGYLFKPDEEGEVTCRISEIYVGPNSDVDNDGTIDALIVDYADIPWEELAKARDPIDAFLSKYDSDTMSMSKLLHGKHTIDDLTVAYESMQRQQQDMEVGDSLLIVNPEAYPEYLEHLKHLKEQGQPTPTINTVDEFAIDLSPTRSPKYKPLDELTQQGLRLPEDKGQPGVIYVGQTKDSWQMGVRISTEALRDGDPPEISEVYKSYSKDQVNLTTSGDSNHNGIVDSIRLTPKAGVDPEDSGLSEPVVYHTDPALGPVTTEELGKVEEKTPTLTYTPDMGRYAKEVLDKVNTDKDNSVTIAEQAKYLGMTDEFLEIFQTPTADPYKDPKIESMLEAYDKTHGSDEHINKNQDVQTQQILAGQVNHFALAAHGAKRLANTDDIKQLALTPAEFFTTQILYSQDWTRNGIPNEVNKGNTYSFGNGVQGEGDGMNEDFYQAANYFGNNERKAHDLFVKMVDVLTKAGAYEANGLEPPVIRTYP